MTLQWGQLVYDQKTYRFILVKNVGVDCSKDFIDIDHVTVAPLTQLTCCF